MKQWVSKLTIALTQTWPLWVLLAIQILLISANFVSDTHLVGWDNLFPEFNFGLNFERTLFGSWQEYRGLGYEDGMSHTANLPYYLLIWVFSFFLPDMTLRYAGMFFTHLMGGIGMYALIYHLLKDKKNKTQKTLFADRAIRQLPALVGAIFYQFNFATVQMYYLPFEPFSVHFAFLPWLILAITQFLETKNRNWLFALAGFSFLATGQAHVPTVFISFGFVVAFFLLFSLIRNFKQQIKPVLLVILVLFLTNAFWGVPFAYSTLKNAHIIANSKNNQMATPDIFVKNQKFGTLENTVLMKGFSLDYIQYDHLTEKSDYMMQEWREFTEQERVKQIGWVLFITSLLGIVMALYRRDPQLYPFIASFAFTFSVIGNDIPGVEVISYTLRTYVPLFKEIFRFVFTKFFILHAFSFSVLLALSITVLTQFGHRYLKLLLATITSISLIFAILLTARPAFNGNFFHQQLREPIPQEYTEVFEFFEKRPQDERVAILPIPWYWAWTQYQWGVIGSGFQWFGIPQPTLDLAFTPWSQQNENVHWELMHAIRSGQASELEAITRKYQIRWLLVDNNILWPNPQADLLAKLNVESVLSTSPHFQFERKFGKIMLYRVNQPKITNNFVSVIDAPDNIGPLSHTQDKDQAMLDFQLYQTSEDQTFDYYYPFRSLFTGKSQTDLEFEVEEKEEFIVFRATLPESVRGYNMIKPAYDHDSLLTFDEDPSVPTYSSYPAVLLDGQPILQVNPDNAPAELSVPLNAESWGVLEVVVPKAYGLMSYDSDPWNDFQQTAKSCDPYRQGEYQHQLIPQQDDGTKTLRLTSKNSSNCIHFTFPDFAVTQSYLLSVEAKNVAGRGLFMSVSDDVNRGILFDTYLDTTQKKDSEVFSYLLSPVNQIGSGYSVNFDNLSFNNAETINELHRISLFQIPYHFLSEIKLVPAEPTTPSLQNIHTGIEVAHPNPTFYKVTISPHQLDNPLLVIWQGDYAGWVGIHRQASFPYFKTILRTSVVNNWAQGWDISSLDPNSTNVVYLFFWPQFLTFFGFSLLLVTPFTIFLLYKKKS